MGDSFINPGVDGAVAAALVMPVILRTVRSATREVDGELILEYARRMKLLVGIFWICWFGFAVAALFAPPKDRIRALTVVAGILLPVVPLHMEFFKVRIAFDSNGIDTRSPWRAARSIPWSEVERAWFSQAMQWYVVQTKEFDRIHLHI